MFRDIKNDKLQFCSLKYGKKNFLAFDFSSKKHLFSTKMVWKTITIRRNPNLKTQTGYTGFY